MGFALSVELVGGTYEAAWGGTSEWPPHPARIFCALVAAAEPGGPDDDALRWLERQPPPVVVVSPAHAGTLEAFVPTNKEAHRSGGHQLYLGRTSAARRWPRSLPEIPTILMEWPEPAPQELAETLGRLARRVPYLGRAASCALIGLSLNPNDQASELQRFTPARGGRLRLRVPYPGYLDALRDAFDNNQPAWIAERAVAYGQQDDAPLVEEPALPAEGPYADLIVVGFPAGVSLDGRHVVAVAQAFKAAMLQRLGRPAPGDPWRSFTDEELDLLNGHHDKTSRQCAVLPLPFVGSEHATGDLLGVGVGLSRDLSPEVRRALLQLLGFDQKDSQPRLRRLHIPGLVTVNVVPADRRWALSPSRWQQSAQRWVSAFPVVVDWWPRRALPPEELIAKGCEVAGLPRPQVEILPASAARGAPLLRRMDLVRRRGDPVHPAYQVALTFPTKVRGPVVVGHLRYLGLGLCTPVTP